MTQAIPITILTGFLGAGKTTLLNRIIHGDHGRRVAVMVNDFGSVNIDSQLVIDVDGDMIALSNGCICCTIRGDFVAAVERVIQREDQPDYILVEASGVADPIDIGLTFKTMPQVTIDSILAVIDAEQILWLDREYAVLAMNQVGVADIIILNKVDLVSTDELERVRDYIRKIAKDARVYETTFADVPLELMLGVGEYDISRLMERAAQDVHVHEIGDESHHPDHHHTDHTQVFKTWTWQSAKPVSLKALRRALDRLPSNIYRAKGFFDAANEPENRVLAQVVGRRVSLQADRAWGDDLRLSQFVVIGGQDLDGELLTGLFDGCLAENAPKSDLERLARGMLSWLRGG